MRRLFSLFLLFVFLAGPVGYYYIYLAARQINYEKIQQEARSGNLENELVVLKLQKGEDENICWKVSGKEFEYQGQLYDVVRSLSSKGSMTYYCFNDRKEKTLVNGLKSHKPFENTTARLAFQLFQSGFLVPGTYLPPLQAVHPISYSEYSGPLSNIISDIHSPPPKENRYS